MNTIRSLDDERWEWENKWGYCVVQNPREAIARLRGVASDQLFDDEDLKTIRATTEDGKLFWEKSRTE